MPGQAARVPSPSTAASVPEEKFRFVCNTCGVALTSSVQNVGRFLDCPKCKSRLRVPEREEAQQQLVRAGLVAGKPPELSPAMWNVLIGGILCGVGTIITVGTYLAAAPEGTYIVTGGAIFWGGIQLIKGLIQLALSKGPASRGSQRVEPVSRAAYLAAVAGGIGLLETRSSSLLCISRRVLVSR